MVTDGQADGPWEKCIRHKELNPYTLRAVTKSWDRIEEMETLPVFHCSPRCTRYYHTLDDLRIHHLEHHDELNCRLCFLAPGDRSERSLHRHGICTGTYNNIRCHVTEPICCHTSQDLVSVLIHSCEVKSLASGTLDEDTRQSIHFLARMFPVSVPSSAYVISEIFSDRIVVGRWIGSTI